jgi:hypothetical protein
MVSSFAVAPRSGFPPPIAILHEALSRVGQTTTPHTLCGSTVESDFHRYHPTPRTRQD